jgi:hypothetical protein
MAVVVDLEDREMGHEPVRRRAVPVLFARLEEDPVARANDLDLPAASLCEADALGDIDRLTVRVRVPRRACPGCEVDAVSAHARRARRHRYLVEVDGAGEPVGRGRVGVDAVPGDLHAASGG